MHCRRWFRLASIVAVAAAVLVLFAACGGDEEEAEDTPTGSATSAAKVAELQDGVLQVGSDIAYAPIEFFEEGTQNPQGLDIDLGNALAEELGVRAEFINTGFDGIIGALNVSRFDVLMSADDGYGGAPEGDRLHPLLRRWHRHPGGRRQPQEHQNYRGPLRPHRRRADRDYPGRSAQGRE